MIYTPLSQVTPEGKKEFIEWIKFLESRIPHLESLDDVQEENKIYHTSEGDIGVTKDIVGTFLATLTNTTITIE